MKPKELKKECKYCDHPWDQHNKRWCQKKHDYAKCNHCLFDMKLDAVL